MNNSIKLTVVLFFLLIISVFILNAQFHYKQGLIYKESSEIKDTISLKLNKLDIVYPRGKNNISTVIFVHGGGLVMGERYLPPIFRDRNFIVVAPSYRLSPIFKCPTYIEDVAAAVAWTFKNIREYGGNEKKIYLTGYSAGAYLAAMVLLDKKYLARYDIDPDSLAGFFSYSGQMTTHFQVLKERGISAGSDSYTVDEFAPLFHVRNTKINCIFFTGEQKLDMPGRYNQNTEIVNKLDSLGNKNVSYIELIGKDHDTFIDTAMLITSNLIQKLELDTMNSGLININNQHFTINNIEKTIKINSTDKLIKNIIFKSNGIAVLSNNDYKIDLNVLENGFYLINSVTEKQTYSTKFILNNN